MKKSKERKPDSQLNKKWEWASNPKAKHHSKVIMIIPILFIGI